MIVTGIEEQTKTKFKVYLDGTFAFVLYKGELKRFGIKQGENLAQENYEKIQNEVLLKRAKKRAMHLLEDMVCIKGKTEGGTISGECNQRSN